MEWKNKLNNNVKPTGCIVYAYDKDSCGEKSNYCVIRNCVSNE